MEVLAVDRLDFRLTTWDWPFAHERRGDIEAHWNALRRKIPSLWNGQVIMLRDYHLQGRSLSGVAFQTDFASFIAWRDWDHPDAGVRNFFAQAALRGSDGAFVLGVMGAQTANAGKIYFPGGTPDPDDLRDGRVDLEASVCRELEEETGLRPSDLTLQPGWFAVFAGPRLGLLKIMQAREAATALQARIQANLARQDEPELAATHLARGPQDFAPQMPDFVRAGLLAMWKA